MSTAGQQLFALAAEEFPNLTDAEKAFLHAIAVGEVARDNSQSQKETDPKHSDTWGQSRTIRARVIRWLCVDRKAISHIDPKGIRIEAAKITGELDLNSVTVPFPLVLKRCAIPDGLQLEFAETHQLHVLYSVSGPIIGTGLIVRGSFVLNGSLVSGGTSFPEAVVRLYGATITGHLECTETVFCNPGRTAIDATRVTVGGSLSLWNLRANGTVRLFGATISGNLNCEGGRFCNPSKVALDASLVNVGGNVELGNYLSCPFRAKGLVNLVGGNIRGSLNLHHAHFSGQGLNGLNARGVAVSGVLDWRAITTNCETIFNLSGARVGQLADDKKSWPQPGKLDLDGFVYTAIFNGPMDAKARRCWLERQAPMPLGIGLEQPLPAPKPFKSQPYQQLAKVLRESGQEVDAKRILIAKEQARRKRGDLGGLARIWSLLLGATIAYGYRPYQALLWAAFWVVLGWGLFDAGYQAKIVIPVKAEAYAADKTTVQLPTFYPAFIPWLYSLDTFVPIINFGQKDYWWPLATCSEPVITHGCILGVHGLHLYRWVHILVGWGLITLVVAGFTSLIRKE
jgi:hypothetical protein